MCFDVVVTKKCCVLSTKITSKLQNFDIKRSTNWATRTWPLDLRPQLSNSKAQPRHSMSVIFSRIMFIWLFEPRGRCVSFLFCWPEISMDTASGLRTTTQLWAILKSEPWSFKRRPVYRKLNNMLLVLGDMPFLNNTCQDCANINISFRLLAEKLECAYGFSNVCNVLFHIWEALKHSQTYFHCLTVVVVNFKISLKQESPQVGHPRPLTFTLIRASIDVSWSERGSSDRGCGRQKRNHTRRTNNSKQ